jgi:hypothetical protein
MAKKKKDEKPAKVNKELGGFDIKINEFGELITSYSIDNINQFLNENLHDKKIDSEEE